MTIDKSGGPAHHFAMAIVKLDQRDIAILRVLSREGRISKSALAERVNLGTSACADRLARLETAGLIRGYRADIALRRLAPHVTVFVLAELGSHEAAAFQLFEAAVERYDEITGCWALGGGYDYLLQVVTRDIDSYQRLIDTVLAERIGLSRYFTHVVTKPIKSAPPPFAILHPETDG
ncbi:Lrp/AsnC family transcriptional regulator [Oceaniglobus indicus]|uniref:Lrp/AsnC family transcriptional regulator n=1 Tax=Oceaniglobus indicus TaxID=2047749 RepID=UPI001F4EB198|nr:Lrp/AsnC family transcriptional regulator [Oceaniglobus indicus]